MKKLEEILKNKKFVIVSPRQKWGGSIVLHVLCKQLQDMGYDAKIFYTEVYKKNRVVFYLRWILYTIKDILLCWSEPLFGRYFPKVYIGYQNVAIKGTKRKWFPFVDNNTIVIYSDVAKWNILKAKNVVRWFLYYPSYNSTDEYDVHDLFICYREIFNDSKLNPEVKRICCPYFDLDLYKKFNFGKRDGKCYIIRKGKNRTDLPKMFDGPIIDNLPEEKKVKIFNECEQCICYDLQTSYSSIAALCGCLSIVVPEEGKDPDFYRVNNKKYGVAYGFSEKEKNFAINTQKLVYQHYKEANERSQNEILKFLQYCVEHFYDEERKERI